MQDLARLVTDEMELRTAAAIDSLHRTMSRRSFSEASMTAALEITERIRKAFTDT